MNLAVLVAFNHLQFSQIRDRQPYLFARKIPYVITDKKHASSRKALILGCSVSEVARRQGINPGLPFLWQRQSAAAAKRAFD
jgi:hypothetical protein